MYLLFREKNWKPSDYYFLKAGEKKITRVFLLHELAERKEEIDKMEQGGGMSYEQGD